MREIYSWVIIAKVSDEPMLMLSNVSDPPAHWVHKKMWITPYLLYLFNIGGQPGINMQFVWLSLIFSRWYVRVHLGAWPPLILSYHITVPFHLLNPLNLIYPAVTQKIWTVLFTIWILTFQSESHPHGKEPGSKYWSFGRNKIRFVSALIS